MKKIRVLVVDDDEVNVALLKAKLEADGYEVDTAGDGIEALNKVNVFVPELILLDIMMPKMDGYEVCKRVKADEKTRFIPVIMLTARASLDDKVVGLDVGADDYIAKPFNLRELSARVRSILTIRELQARLTETEKLAALGHMADGVAHEVRNPLMTIGGLARRVYEKLSNEQLKEYMDVIIRNVSRLENMMHHIDEYKKILVSELSDGNINDVVLDAISEAKEQARIKGESLGISFAPSIIVSLSPTLSHIKMDKGNIKKAVLNIIQNAIEATHEKGDINISTAYASDKRQIEVQISDTGCGIKKEDVKNIFNPFYTSKMTGAGLGLTISHKIIEDHNGEIEVESKEGKGTVVIIRLPVSNIPANV
ncbi:MAG: response regulator [Deltaproteobacteria bacterium]|nr:response regulator [Deltaproteobacteria bacterium]